MTELFGIGRFRFIEWPNRLDSKYYFRGNEEQIKIRQAFTQVGPLELELIQPLEGEKNAYYEFLKQKGGGFIIFCSKSRTWMTRFETSRQIVLTFCKRALEFGPGLAGRYWIPKLSSGSFWNCARWRPGVTARPFPKTLRQA